MEDPGKGSSGATGGKKGAERRGQLEGTANGRGGVKEARLGRSFRGLPRWQQGPSRQGTGAEPSPRERERDREKGREGERERVSECPPLEMPPFMAHFLFLFAPA